MNDEDVGVRVNFGEMMMVNYGWLYVLILLYGVVFGVVVMFVYW